jgi:multidrug resistance efflux pump
MKTIALLFTTAICGATAFAQQSSPEELGRIRAQQERLQKIFQAAENLQAAGMEREADQLRENARRQMELLEAKVRQAREHAQPEREKTDREHPEREQPKRDQARPDLPRDGAVRPPPERPRGDVAQLNAQIAELRATVHRLGARVERLEAFIRKAHTDMPDMPRPDMPRPELQRRGDAPPPGDAPRREGKRE